MSDIAVLDEYGTSFEIEVEQMDETTQRFCVHDGYKIRRSLSIVFDSKTRRVTIDIRVRSAIIILKATLNGADRIDVNLAYTVDSRYLARAMAYLDDHHSRVLSIIKHVTK